MTRTLLMLLVLTSTGWSAPRRTALVATVVLKVVHPDEARTAILAAVAPLGGFATLVSDQALNLKVPPERLSEVLKQVGERGITVQKTLQRNDLTQSLAQMEARLRSKVDIFQRTRKLVDDSDVGATLQIERQMASLVGEMEKLRGRLRVEHERARFAVVSVSFQFREREKLVYVRSPFDWINSVDLSRFHADF
jgi:hypothetical protein